MAKVTVQVNGREVQVEEGLNLIEAARLADVEIPHFCYHPGLGVDGNCRMCLIEVDGIAKPQIACNTFAKEGLKFQTESARVKELQRAVLEFLFLNHPLDCPICDQSGECYLQDYYMANGRYQSRLDTEKVHKRKVVEAGPRVTLDAERCVLCSRCVRFCDQVTGTGELYIVNRGNRSEIAVYPGKELDNAYSLNTVDICPVGALTSTEFRFQKRVWFLRASDAVCTGCARGCNVYLEESEGRVYRLRPRENMEVNRYWMCDHGRGTFRPMNDERLDVAFAAGEIAPLGEVLSKLAEALGEAAKANGGAGVLFGLSPASSLESLFATQAFAAEFLPKARVSAGATRAALPEDDLLRKADPYANRAGLGLLKIPIDLESALAKGGDLLVWLEDDPIGQAPALREQLRGWKRIVYVGTNENATSGAANLCLPIAPASECDGTFVNFAGRVQRFRRGVQPQGDALWTPELWRRVAEGMGRPFGWKSLDALWKDLAAKVPELDGLDFQTIGALGVPTQGRSGAAAAHAARP